MGRRERQRERKREFWVKIILGAVSIFIVAGMMLGGLMGGGQDSSNSYNGFSFEIANNRYVTEINGKEVYFYTHPAQAEFFNLSNIAINKLKESYLIMTTFDPAETASLQAIEIVRFDFSQYLGKPVFNGVIQKSPEYNLPIVDCANATQTTPVVVLNASEATGITEKGNCIYLNAKGTEFLRLRDRILYSYFGVIKDE